MIVFQENIQITAKMPEAAFFARLGLFVLKEFLDPELCAQLRSQADLNEQRKASIAGKDPDSDEVDEGIRRTKQVTLPTSALSHLQEQLLTVKPAIESHFKLPLTGCERPQLLLYKEGDFFQAHRDRSYDPRMSCYAHKREVSVVVFLNSQDEAVTGNSYCGGSLVLYGVINGQKWQKYGFPVKGEEGLLIAFRADLAHEVKCVTAGDRFTVVSWFF